MVLPLILLMGKKAFRPFLQALVVRSVATFYCKKNSKSKTSYKIWHVSKLTWNPSYFILHWPQKTVILTETMTVGKPTDWYNFTNTHGVAINTINGIKGISTFSTSISCSFCGVQTRVHFYTQMTTVIVTLSILNSRLKNPFSWKFDKVGVKHQSINQSIDLYKYLIPVPLHLLIMCHVLVRHRKHYNVCLLVCFY
jgi:hypothetical protein